MKMLACSFGKAFARLPKLVRGYSTIGSSQTAWLEHTKHVGFVELIREHTEVSRSHLTPEIALHLITLSCKLWAADARSVPFVDPFWAFYWPGGQAVSRYILDHPHAVRGARVLDLGSGSGACAIAAAVSGAGHVLANDTDPVAVVACLLNARLNDVSIDTCPENLVDSGECASSWDLVLLGDMLYDHKFACKLLAWAKTRHEGVRFLVGDPGRLPLAESRGSLKRVAEYVLPEHVCKENNGFHSACVWQLDS